MRIGPGAADPTSPAQGSFKLRSSGIDRGLRLTDFLRLFFLLPATLIALEISCSGSPQPTAVPTPQYPGAQAAPTPSPTATLTPLPTATPSPSPTATLTPLPTATPSPSPLPSSIVDLFPEVWSSNGHDGQTYEYKTNCFNAYDKLEACPLFHMSRVVVISPRGTEYDLQRDFNVNAYSGEVTRRWVLYGPPGAGRPAPGEYRFLYYQSGEVVLQQSITYRPEVISYPTDVRWRREGAALVVSWTPPEDLRDGMWYKVLVFPDEGQLISKVFEWSAREARLEDVPIKDGAHATVNVAIYFHGGYAYSEYIPLEW